VFGTLVNEDEMTESLHRPSAPELQTKFIVARMTDIAPGERLIVNVLGRSVGVLNVDGVYHAFLNRCPHRGAQLCHGDVVGALESSTPGEFVLNNEKKFLQCQWHGWEFDLVTGESWFDPVKMRARPFGVQVEQGSELAAEVDEGVAGVPDNASPQFVDPATHRIKGPYTADVVPVTVEDDYIVITMRRRPPSANGSASVGEEAHETRNT
jgi:nitrite reductase/ring-hydroxylating ferredoxin subunit